MPTVRIQHQSDVAQFFREKGFNAKNSLPGLMRQVGRLCAVSLAFQAQPFGDDARAEAIGKIAVNRDIYKVYTTPGKAFDDIGDSKSQGAFWKAAKRSAWDIAQKILARAGNALKFTPILRFDGGAAHRSLRNNRGRIAGAQKPVMIVQNPEALKAYVVLETNKVGYGKGGWASCARSLGGTRGIPGWISRHNSPAQVIERYGADLTQITLINRVPYASAILTESQKAEAVNIAADRLFRSIQIAARQGSANLV